MLLLAGTLFLAAALAYGSYSLLNGWLMTQSRYMQADELMAMPAPAPTWTPSPTTTPVPLPTDVPTLTPMPSATPYPSPLPPPAPVQIRIPTLGISRSIISLPRVPAAQLGVWDWDTSVLFRQGRSDLVGHWSGSVRPGEKGNMILVGHNYGYGFSGVFVHLGSLRPGDKVTVVNQDGESFVYRVRSVDRVEWRLQNFGELTQHLRFLSPGGPEQLTLVSCGGAELEPFPERVYVVAEPVDG
jgi:LPXTG-site transpeptidase (sortase) family protein